MLKSQSLYRSAFQRDNEPSSTTLANADSHHARSSPPKIDRLRN